MTRLDGPHLARQSDGQATIGDRQGDPRAGQPGDGGYGPGELGRRDQ